jgi:hypothetical protein
VVKKIVKYLREGTMKINGKITFLCNKEGATIELHDDDASVTFARVRLTAEQLCQALGRLAYTECYAMEVRGLDKVGMKMENKEFVFEVPDDLPYQREKRNEILSSILQKICPEGWIPSILFNSQNSFFTKDGKYYARTTIRRWVQIDRNQGKDKDDSKED